MEEKLKPPQPRENGLIHPDDVTPAHFLAVLESFGDNMKDCPSCGHNHWLIQLDGEHLPLSKMPVAGKGLGWLTFYTYCSNCGHVNTYMAECICRLVGELK